MPGRGCSSSLQVSENGSRARPRLVDALQRPGAGTAAVGGGGSALLGGQRVQQGLHEGTLVHQAGAARQQAPEQLVCLRAPAKARCCAGTRLSISDSPDALLAGAACSASSKQELCVPLAGYTAQGTGLCRHGRPGRGRRALQQRPGEHQLRRGGICASSGHAGCCGCGLWAVWRGGALQQGCEDALDDGGQPGRVWVALGQQLRTGLA